jgi:hypothetical protein
MFASLRGTYHRPYDGKMRMALTNASQDELLSFRASRARRTRAESSDFALFSTARLLGLRLCPARFMKKVSMRIPEPGPFGETFFDASIRAIVAASLLKSPAGG